MRTAAHSETKIGQNFFIRLLFESENVAAESAQFPRRKQSNFARPVNRLNRLEQESDVARRPASVETEIFHELPIILVDRCGHMNGPLIIAFVQLPAKGFQSLLVDRPRQFHTGSRRRWGTIPRFTDLEAGP